MLNVSQSELGNLEALLLNNAGNVPLHNRFRALFTLKALKSEEAVRIISKGFQDPSALLKHELAYCLGQMKNAAALPILESVLANDREDPMVRHEVSCLFPVSSHRRSLQLQLHGFHIAH
jgi:deoxyhypusine monooxygenase